MKGETLNLVEKNYKKLRIALIVCVIICVKILFPIISLGFIILQSVFMYIAYIDSDVNYNLPIYICWWFYYCFCAIQVTATVMNIVVLVGYMILYLILRFDQVNEKIKSMGQYKRLNYISIVSVIAEHYSIANKVAEFNSILTFAYGVFYFGITASIDISLFIAIYGKNSLVRFICGNLAFLLFIMVLLFASFLAMVITKAHWSYQSMNSLLATKRIPLRLKFKVIYKI